MPTEDFNRCFSEAPKTGPAGRFGDIAVCLSKLDLHVDLTYQPNDRYWTFQWLEAGGYLLVSAILYLLAAARLRRSVA